MPQAQTSRSAATAIAERDLFHAMLRALARAAARADHLARSPALTEP